MPRIHWEIEEYRDEAIERARPIFQRIAVSRKFPTRGGVLNLFSLIPPEVAYPGEDAVNTVATYLTEELRRIHEAGNEPAFSDFAIKFEIVHRSGGYTINMMWSSARTDTDQRTFEGE